MAPLPLDGRVMEDASLLWQVGPFAMRSAHGQGNQLVVSRGGYLDFSGKNTETNELHAWRLYVVIAANEECQWNSPREQFAALLLGTHPRLGVNSKVLQLGSGVLQNIHSFVKRAPIWSDLEDQVEQASLHLCDPSLSPSQLVHQYRTFLALKVEREDWMSLELSPPMIKHNGLRLVDEVWHLHISMSSYEEDCALLTDGHIITHQPVLGSQAIQRYKHTYDLYRERCDALGECVDNRCWPDPIEWFGDYDPLDSGCC